MIKIQKPILEIDNMTVSFRQYYKGLRQTELEVISGLNIKIQPGEILAIVGSSGSGKSLLAHAILGILPSNSRVSGSMKYHGQELTAPIQAELRGKKIALVPQSITYLDPLMKIGEQVRGTSGSIEAQRRVFKKYQLAPETEKMYPFQLSGGMARRVLVSTAVISEADLIIADEPTPGLHPAVASETIRHLRALADEGRSVMLITHELDLAFQIADRIAVFYGGTILEVAPVADFICGGEALRHPYSKALWNALPQNGFQSIEGVQPYAGRKDSGCVFAARCQIKTEECNRTIEMQELRDGMVRCCHAT